MYSYFFPELKSERIVSIFYDKSDIPWEDIAQRLFSDPEYQGVRLGDIRVVPQPDSRADWVLFTLYYRVYDDELRRLECPELRAGQLVVEGNDRGVKLSVITEPPNGGLDAMLLLIAEVFWEFRPEVFKGFQRVRKSITQDLGDLAKIPFAKLPHWCSYRAATSVSGAVTAISEVIERRAELTFTQVGTEAVLGVDEGLWLRMNQRLAYFEFVESRWSPEVRAEMRLEIRLQKDPGYDETAPILVEVYGDPNDEAWRKAWSQCNSMQSWWPVDGEASLAEKSQVHGASRVQRSIEATIDLGRQTMVVDSDKSPSAVSDEPYVPMREENRRRWRRTWRTVRQEYGKGRPLLQLVKWLETRHPEVACNRDTLRSIVNAGKAGLLDENSD